MKNSTRFNCALSLVALVCGLPVSVLADGEGVRRGPREQPGRVSAEAQSGRRVAPEAGAIRRGPRDGEGMRQGPRDGEGVQRGPRDGEGMRQQGPRDGEGVRRGPRDGMVARPVVLRLDAAGQVLAGNGRPMPIDQVRGHLVRMAGSGAYGSVTIQAPGDMPFGNVVSVMNVAKQAGFQNVNFSTAPQASVRPATSGKVDQSNKQ